MSDQRLPKVLHGSVTVKITQYDSVPVYTGENIDKDVVDVSSR